MIKLFYYRLKSILYSLRKSENETLYLLALFNKKHLTNKVFKFKTPKEAKEFIKTHDFEEWEAYLIDLRNKIDRTYIKLN